ncbi:MAG: integrase arm-type DNA-binding domain-containing protein [Proteobacteria bacterium]|nr:integrase arm-type DNA-binding domain-containing protein [Pseudomonadota bacterium]
MAREPGKLTALAVARAKRRGLYSDGGGLYLQVASSGARSWIFRYQTAGRRHYMGLGGAAAVSLADARQKAGEARRVLGAGNDPINATRTRVAASAAKAANAITFSEAAARYIDSHAAGWRSEKHAAQWRATLETYVVPVLGNVPVALVDVAMILKVLEPIWFEKHETARRLRGRIEAVLDWAAARNMRTGDNPARWRERLVHLLPNRPKATAVRHHPALPYVQMGEFMAELRLQRGTAARALEFLALTAARTSEVTGAQWQEIDIGGAIWVVPSSRIKAGKEHRVPLSALALAILRTMAKTRRGVFVFPGGKPARPLTNMAMAGVLKRMGRDEITVHGFRSTFRDWAAEMTNYPREVAEMALAHSVGDKVEAAYRRGDLFDKRRRIMAEWAKHCARIERTMGVKL